MYHPQAVNREAAAEPPATRQPGAAGFYATALWLRAAFSGLRWEVHQATRGAAAPDGWTRDGHRLMIMVCDGSERETCHAPPRQHDTRDE